MNAIEDQVQSPAAHANGLGDRRAWRVNHDRILGLAVKATRERGGYVTTAELLSGSGLSRGGFYRHLRAMQRDGELVKCERGLWLVGEARPANKNAPRGSDPAGVGSGRPGRMESPIVPGGAACGQDMAGGGG